MTGINISLTGESDRYLASLFFELKKPTIPFQIDLFHTKSKDDKRRLPFCRKQIQIIFLKWNCLILMLMSLKINPKGPINSKPSLV